MGLGNFIKRKSGAYKLPESHLNEESVYKVLKNNIHFIVTLPIVETKRIGRRRSISYKNTTSYTPPESISNFRKVNTLVNCEPTQLRIQHALKNGQHEFVKYQDISLVTELKYGVLIELKNGKQYKFEFDKQDKKNWKSLGFNPQFPIHIFYKFLLGDWKTAFTNKSKNKNKQKENKQKTETREKYTQNNKEDKWVICYVCEKKYIKTAKNCPYCGAINDKTKNKSPKDIKRKSEIKCPKCGHINSKNISKCWKCGENLE